MKLFTLVFALMTAAVLALPTAHLDSRQPVDLGVSSPFSGYQKTRQLIT